MLLQSMGGIVSIVVTLILKIWVHFRHGSDLPTRFWVISTVEMTSERVPR